MMKVYEVTNKPGKLSEILDSIEVFTLHHAYRLLDDCKEDESVFITIQIEKIKEGEA